jgi:hypothetical protein
MNTQLEEPPAPRKTRKPRVLRIVGSYTEVQPGVFNVVGSSGLSYLTDTRSKCCSCKGFRSHGHCYHLDWMTRVVTAAARFGFDELESRKAGFEAAGDEKKAQLADEALRLKRERAQSLVQRFTEQVRGLSGARV